MPIQHPKRKRLQKSQKLLSCLRVSCDKENIPISRSDGEFEKALNTIIKSELRSASRIGCYGCEVDHPSQTQHYCLMAQPEELVLRFYDDVYDRVLEGDEFIKRVWDAMDDKAKTGLNWLKYRSKDSFVMLATKLREKIKDDLESDYMW